MPLKARSPPMLTKQGKDAESLHHNLAQRRERCIAPTCVRYVRDSCMLLSYQLPPCRLAFRKKMEDYADTLQSLRGGVFGSFDCLL